MQRALPETVFRSAARVETAHLASLIREWRPDLLVIDLDRAVPGVLARLPPPATGRGRVPVLGLTRGYDVDLKLAAIDMGADDVLDLPFTPDELLVRMASLSGREEGRATRPAIGGPLEIDILHRQVRVGGTEVHLTGVEQSLLALLLARPGEVVSREEIREAVWGSGYVPDSNIVERHIHALRRKLGDDWHRPRYVETVHGRGYRLLIVTAGAPPGGETDAASASGP